MSICSTEPRKPLYIASNFIPRLFQCSAIGRMSPVRSRYVKPVNPPVCVDSTAVGMTETSMPMAEIIGRATVSEHLPKPEISCMAAALLSLSMCITRFSL